MDAVTPAGPVEPTAEMKAQPVTFSRTGGEGDAAERFTIPGILRAAESEGYAVKDPQAPGLAVTMFEYQRQTHQWMLDHEKDPVGRCLALLPCECHKHA
jgi:hypothetical protein